VNTPAKVELVLGIVSYLKAADFLGILTRFVAGLNPTDNPSDPIWVEYPDGAIV
jgi:hypothetical protein